MCAVHGGGVHIWDIKLKTFIDLLYVKLFIVLLVEVYGDSDNCVVDKRQ